MTLDAQPGVRRPVDLWSRVGDGVLAAALWTLITLEIWVIGEQSLSTSQQVLATILAPVVALPLAVRSVDAFVAFLINSAATVGMVTVGFISDYYQWANLLLLFMVSISFRGRKSWVALAVGLGGVVYYFVSFRSEGLDTGIMVFGLWLMVWLIGRVYSSRVAEDNLRSDRDLAAELAAARQARLELESQRTRMARELHDLIGHTVNVMVVHAGAGRRAVHTDPAGAEQAFVTIETTGRSALDELDRVLGVLRSDDPDAPLAPLPGLSSLPVLVDEFAEAGLPVDLRLVGPTASVPAGVGLTIYRIVQEALTNTMKHAKASKASVSVEVAVAEVIVLVEDDGVGRVGPEGASDGSEADGGADGTGSGRGLIGIAERVQLQGGFAEFGPAEHPSAVSAAGANWPRSGFRVHCVLPLVHSEVGA